MSKNFNIHDWQAKINEQNYASKFDKGMQDAGGFSDEEMDDITSRDIGSPFPGTDDVSNGYKAARAFIDEFREITYKQLSEEERDTFSKEMILHFLDNTTAKAAVMIQLGKEAGPDPADDPHNQELPF